MNCRSDAAAAAQAALPRSTAISSGDFEACCLNLDAAGRSAAQQYESGCCLRRFSADLVLQREKYLLTYSGRGTA